MQFDSVRRYPGLPVLEVEEADAADGHRHGRKSVPKDAATANQRFKTRAR